MRYRVELEELLAFADRLQAFESNTKTITSHVDAQIAALHTTWSGDAADAHRARHQEWMAGASQMHDALVNLRTAAHTAHRNYTDAAQLNLEMLQ